MLARSRFRFLALDWRARFKSKDPDALYARTLAAELMLLADQVEALPGETIGRMPLEDVERARFVDDRRDFLSRIRNEATRTRSVRAPQTAVIRPSPKYSRAQSPSMPRMESAVSGQQPAA